MFLNAKTHEMCDKVVNTHSSTIQFVPECYKKQKMCDKAFNKCFLAFFYIPNQYKTQEMFDKIISNDPFLLRYDPDQYKTEKMCDKVVDDCLAALKFVPDWFITSRMIKILVRALNADENILYFNEDSSNVVFICNGMGIIIDLNVNFDGGYPDTITHAY